jgi:acetylornithine deacetylase/succinyl-diaminopimelate desuccinylase-like protein
MSVRSLTTSELIRRLMPTAREDLEQLVSFRSVADPRQAAPEGCEKAARCLVDVFSELGGRGRIHPTAGGSVDAIIHCGACLDETYGTAPVMTGQGGSIPLCTVFQETLPNTEIMIMGVDEPACLVHAPNESVDPTEIERMALAQVRFLQTYPNPNR